MYRSIQLKFVFRNNLFLNCWLWLFCECCYMRRVSLDRSRRVLILCLLKRVVATSSACACRHGRYKMLAFTQVSLRGWGSETNGFLILFGCHLLGCQSLFSHPHPAMSTFLFFSKIEKLKKIARKIKSMVYLLLLISNRVRHWNMESLFVCFFI